ncbi:hypothetical protein BpHYR1_023504, partial [Brachionus plicatilis]
SPIRSSPSKGLKRNIRPNKNSRPSVDVTSPVLSFISDSPARSKACFSFSVQFNGFCGCVKCLHPGERKNNRRVYPVSENVLIRSPDVYNNQVKGAIEQVLPVKTKY